MSYSNGYVYLSGTPPAALYRPPGGSLGEPTVQIAGGSAPNMPSVDDQRLDSFLTGWKGLQIADPLASLIYGKATGLREQIREILFQLELRSALGRELQRRNSEGALEVRSQLLNLENLAFWDPVAAKRRANLESRLDGLYCDRGHIQLDLWKDQRELREKLIYLLGQYGQAAARQRLIQGPYGGN